MEKVVPVSPVSPDGSSHSIQAKVGMKGSGKKQQVYGLVGVGSYRRRKNPV